MDKRIAGAAFDRMGAIIVGQPRGDPAIPHRPKPSPHRIGDTFFECGARKNCSTGGRHA